MRDERNSLATQIRGPQIKALLLSRLSGRASPGLLVLLTLSDGTM